VQGFADDVAMETLCNLSLKKRPGRLHIFKIATEDFPDLLAPSGNMLPLKVFDRKYLVEYSSREIWLSDEAKSMASFRWP
jgi:hypothetical protein